MNAKLFYTLVITILVAPIMIVAYTSSSVSGADYTPVTSTKVAPKTYGSSESASSTTSVSVQSSATGDSSISNSSSTYNGADSTSGTDYSVNDKENSSYSPQACNTYIVNYIRIGGNNNPQDVKNLQTFLNTYEGERLAVDGVYKEVDVAAVKRFQTKYIETLKFWGLTSATGEVLQTTINKINTIYCEKAAKLSCPYFGSYQKLGSASNEVIKIKKFLNNTQGENLNIQSNVFDDALFAAVKRFQGKYLNTALKPWGITTATGFWYQSTRKTAHDVIGCFEAVRLDNGVVLR